MCERFCLLVVPPLHITTSLSARHPILCGALLRLKMLQIRPAIQAILLYSAKPLLGHHALVWLLGFRMAGFMLSGSGIRVFVLGNMGLGWGGLWKVQVNDGGGWVVYIAYLRCMKGAIVRLMSCNAPLKVSRLVGKYIRLKSVPLGYCSWEKSCICGSCGRLIFVCICVGGWILFGCVRAWGIGWDWCLRDCLLFYTWW